LTQASSDHLANESALIDVCQSERMPWRLLTCSPGGSISAATVLPRVGAVTIGRRPGNSIVSAHPAVSGHHCVLHCGHPSDGSGVEGAPVELPPPVEVEDRSSNGMYVNNTKLVKGRRWRLAHGDTLCLTRQLEKDAGQEQFRIEFDETGESAADAAVGGVSARTGISGQCPIAEPATPTPPSVPSPSVLAPGTPAGSRAAESGHIVPPVGLAPGAATPSPSLTGNFAQELLMQEQQSKAKLTSELLRVRQKIQEQGKGAEGLGNELQEFRRRREEERTLRREAEESRDRLANEIDVLRTERQQLQELRATHSDLQQKCKASEAELHSRQQHADKLATEHAKFQCDVARAKEVNQEQVQQQSELQARLRQALERSERLDHLQMETQRAAARALEEVARVEEEVLAERSAQKTVEEQVAQRKEQASKAGDAEEQSRKLLAITTSRCATLECQINAACAEAEAARTLARHAIQMAARTRQSAGQLHETTRGIAMELRQHADLFEKAPACRGSDAFNESSNVGGETLVQASGPKKRWCDDCGGTALNDSGCRRGVTDAGTGSDLGEPVDVNSELGFEGAAAKHSQGKAASPVPAESIKSNSQCDEQPSPKDVATPVDKCKPAMTETVVAGVCELNQVEPVAETTTPGAMESHVATPVDKCKPAMTETVVAGVCELNQVEPVAETTTPGAMESQRFDVEDGNVSREGRDWDVVERGRALASQLCAQSGPLIDDDCDRQLDGDAASVLAFLSAESVRKTAPDSELGGSMRQTFCDAQRAPSRAWSLQVLGDLDLDFERTKRVKVSSTLD